MVRSDWRELKSVLICLNAHCRIKLLWISEFEHWKKNILTWSEFKRLQCRQACHHRNISWLNNRIGQMEKVLWFRTEYGIFVSKEIKNILNLYLRFTLLVVVVQFLLPLVVIIILYYRIYVYLKVDWKIEPDEVHRK